MRDRSKSFANWLQVKNMHKVKAKNSGVGDADIDSIQETDNLEEDDFDEPMIKFEEIDAI
jgi:hypothetical protein